MSENSTIGTHQAPAAGNGNVPVSALPSSGTWCPATQSELFDPRGVEACAKRVRCLLRGGSKLY